MTLHWSKILSAAGVVLALGTGAASAAEVKFQRFFGECGGEYGDVTDLAAANGECGIITVLMNDFNANNADGHKIILAPVAWADHYDKLKASYAAGDQPDIAVMHGSRLPQFLNRKLIADLTDGFASVGVDTADFVGPATQNSTRDGKFYALPFDVHGTLWHVNKDVLKAAGQLNDDGSPIVPDSLDALMAQAKAVVDATGNSYLGVDMGSAGIASWMWMNFVWQQGGSIVQDGKAAFNTPEGLKALEAINALVDMGAIIETNDYGAAQEAFLNGELAVLVNGTWVPDSYRSQAESGDVTLKDYTVVDFPNIFGEPASWTDSHMWVIPRNPKRDPEVQEAALAFLKYLNDNNYQWSRTGHMSVRQSVIDSDEFNMLPLRSSYAGISVSGRAVPRMNNYTGFEEALKQELRATWQNGKDMATALADAEARANQVMGK